VKPFKNHENERNKNWDDKVIDSNPLEVVVAVVVVVVIRDHQ